MEKKSILTGEKMDLLQFIHEKTVVVIGKREIKTNKGVPQGNISSPILFNIATEDLLE